MKSWLIVTAELLDDAVQASSEDPVGRDSVLQTGNAPNERGGVAVEIA